MIRARIWSLSLTHGYPDHIFYFGLAPGDDLLCTTVLHELQKRSSRKIWMISNHPELFQGMGDATRILPPTLRSDSLRRYRHLEYARYRSETDRSDPPARHIIAELCAKAGITGKVALRPYLHLTAAEKADGQWAAGKIVIQSSGLGGKFQMKNKQWPAERFQAVVDALRDEIDFVQIGSASDPLLAHVQDLRGKTTIREAASFLSNARLYVGNAGFLMHAARAVECPSVIIFGGREAPWQSGYPANENLYTALPCSPCWLWNKCDYDRKCMNEISAQDVVRAVQTKLNQPRGPLPVDVVEISDPATEAFRKGEDEKLVALSGR